MFRYLTKVLLWPNLKHRWVSNLRFQHQSKAFYTQTIYPDLSAPAWFINILFYSTKDSHADFSIMPQSVSSWHKILYIIISHFRGKDTLTALNHCNSVKLLSEVPKQNFLKQLFKQDKYLSYTDRTLLRITVIHTPAETVLPDTMLLAGSKLWNLWQAKQNKRTVFLQWAAQLHQVRSRRIFVSKGFMLQTTRR